MPPRRNWDRYMGLVVRPWVGTAIMVPLILLAVASGCSPAEKEERTTKVATSTVEAGTEVQASPSPVTTAEPVTNEASDADAALELSIQEPGEGATVAIAEVTIRGTAPANAGVRHDRTGPDGSARANAEGQWEYQVKLSKGKNQFKFFLQDDKEAKATLNVTYREAPPTAQPVAKETFAVNGAEVTCRREPSADAEVVVLRPPGTVQAMDAVLKKDGTWHKEVADQCWVRTDRGEIKIVDTLQAAEAQASSIRRKPVEDYGKRLMPIIDRYATQLGKVGTLANSPLLLNPDWQKQFKAAMEDLKKVGQDARKISAPPCVAQPHATFIQAVDLFDFAADLAIPGAANANADQISLAAASMTEGGATLERATKQFDAAFAACPR